MVFRTAAERDMRPPGSRSLPTHTSEGGGLGRTSVSPVRRPPRRLARTNLSRPALATIVELVLSRLSPGLVEPRHAGGTPVQSRWRCRCSL